MKTMQFNPVEYNTHGDVNLLLLHGFMGSAEDWSEVIAALPKEIHCLTLNLPGHGRNVIDAQDLPDIPQTIDALFSNFIKPSQKKWVIAGYSMGGRIALHLALKYQDNCEALILESTHPGIADEKQKDERLQSDRNLAMRIEKRFDASFLLDWYSQPLFGRLANHPNYPQLISQRLLNQPEQLMLAIESFSTGKQHYLTDQLSRALFPVCLVNGQLDQKYLTINGQMYSQVPHARWMSVAHCGHNVHFEQADVFAGIVYNFIHSIHGG